MRLEHRAVLTGDAGTSLLPLSLLSATTHPVVWHSHKATKHHKGSGEAVGQSSVQEVAGADRTVGAGTGCGEKGES